MQDDSSLARQHEAVRDEFTRQAESWARDEIDGNLLWAVDRLNLRPAFSVLDVAAGTGLLARAIAPRVTGVVAIDLTPEMLAHGRRCAERDRIENLRFDQGAAETLPYEPESFNAVVTRFSVHHFQDPEVVLRQMGRVCRRGGVVGVIDIVAPEDEALAEVYNGLERLRDPSHTRALTPHELKRTVESVGIRVTGDFHRDVSNDVTQWLDRTRSPAQARVEILEALGGELAGGPPTGMRPFESAGRLQFMHDWEILVGIRE